MTAFAKNQLPNRTLWASQPIHMPAFFGALFLAPILVTALTFFLVVPMFALIMGGLPYLILGTPILLWRLSQVPCTPSDCAVAAVSANTAASVLALLYCLSVQDDNLAGVVTLYMLFGTIFAPVWGATFGYLYNSFTKQSANA